MSSESDANLSDYIDREPVEQNVATQHTNTAPVDVDEEIRLIVERIRRIRNETNATNNELTQVYPNIETDVGDQQMALYNRVSGVTESDALGNHNSYSDIMDMILGYEIELSNLAVDSHSTENVTSIASGASVNFSVLGNPPSTNSIGGNVDNGDSDLRKNYMIKKVVGFVETINAQHEFCDFFNNKLVEYFRDRGRYLSPKPIDSNEKPECLKRRFAAAVGYMDSLISSDQSAIKILEDCYTKFHDNHDILFSLIVATNANALAETLESLLANEINPFLRHTLRFEIKILNELRANMQSILSELMNTENKSTGSYAGMLDKIQILLRIVNGYQPHPIVSTNDHVLTRINVLTTIKENMNNDLRNLQSEVERLKTELEEKETRERDRAYGHFVHINIVPSPREQREQMLRSQSESRHQSPYQSQYQSQFQSQYQSQYQSQLQSQYQLQSEHMQYPQRNAYMANNPYHSNNRFGR